MGGNRKPKSFFNSLKRANGEQSSTHNLYRSLKPNEVPVVYSENYNITFLGLQKLHPFDSEKWRRVHEILKEAGFLCSGKRLSVEPLEAKSEDLLVVHPQKYLDQLRWSSYVARVTEIFPVAVLPNFLVQKNVLSPLRYQTGGSILAGKLAVDHGWSINIGGGFHHCCAVAGGGFCAYADITLTIKFLFNRVSSCSKAMIVDLDAHQGNGHERDFAGDRQVYIMDVYNAFIYPNDQQAKRSISRKVELDHHTDDETYLSKVKTHLEGALNEFHPDILIYNAGTDVLKGDPLGNLDITPQGVIERDEIVWSQARKRKIPIVMLTSGGYQKFTARVIAESILNLDKKGLLEFSTTNGNDSNQ